MNEFQLSAISTNDPMANKLPQKGDDLQVERDIRHMTDSVLSIIKIQSDCEQIFKSVKQDSPGRWNAIRDMYRHVDPNNYDPYLVDWSLVFSPIEEMAWGEIRCNSLPFWPQFPIGPYFADFADPIKKIVIECDGRDFHSKEKDAARDAYMNSNGWAVYRISGADCNRIMTSPWEVIIDKDIEHDSDEARRMYDDWFHNTVDGLILSLAIAHYGRRALNDHEHECAASVVSSRRSRGASHG